MSLVSAWGQDDPNDAIDLATETTASSLRKATQERVKLLLYVALNAGDVNAIKNIFQFNRDLLNGQLYGFEGADVYGKYPNSKTGRCYTYTGIEEKDKEGNQKDYFYPIHVAAETSNKILCLMLAKAGADLQLQDYRGHLAREVANGEAIHAFHELDGKVFEAYERFEGIKDRNGNRTGQGRLYCKKEGYESKEFLLYKGIFKQDKYHGAGKLYWEGSDEVLRYDGRFRSGAWHGRGIEYNEQGNKIYTGVHRAGRREGQGIEYYVDESLNSLVKAKVTVLYSGEFVRGNRHGFGVCYMGPGHTYIGAYADGRMNGIGIYVQPNGDLYEGKFLEIQLSILLNRYHYHYHYHYQYRYHYHYYYHYRYSLTLSSLK